MSKTDFKIRIDMDNTEEAKAELKAKKRKIFHAWGIKWKEIVTPLVPVDTGRLRQSMHFKSRTNDVAVGTNVYYAIFINNGTRGTRVKGGGSRYPKLNDKFSKKKRKKYKKRGTGSGHKAIKFMERSTLEKKDTYKRLAEAILKE